ncbi:glutaminase [Aeromicrobium wangtongii]|uniref:Glutaminase n=1 Tax=Aeromicrobium wangtongii TaxID=2969247 RepID=A0ABY5MEG2_9ACTN|nr:glutaminase [Aeromicrobium wangtongii]MCD9197937.1 glutaminase [Aeromicrobium wangtongii]UUP15415.1 glutaminase [Aeromicrobium wangtongii]
MRPIIPDYLTDALADVEPDVSGELAAYIPELAGADPDRLGAVFATLDGTIYGAGDIDHEFTIQSISKPFTYALALADRGFHPVLDKVGVEPSGEAFNQISLEHGSGRPLNPMINAGAITAHSLAGPQGLDPAGRVERVIDGLSAFAGRRLAIDEAVCASEMGHAHRNLAIAHMLRSYDILTEDPTAVVEGYVRQCSVLVTARDLGVMAATLANGGVNPLSGEQVIPRPVVRQVLSVMATCGMYDAAGDWATHVGIPAKSGVAGGLIGALPGQIGIATFSPRLDAHGNSVRGVSLFEQFSSDAGLHVMEVPESAPSVVRSNRVDGDRSDAVRVIQLQGGIRFAGAERIVREAAGNVFPETKVALDLRMVYSIDDVARRMLLEVTRRLTLDGHDVYLVDPESILPDPDPGDGGRVTVVEDLHHVVRNVLATSQAMSGPAERRVPT